MEKQEVKVFGQTRNNEEAHLYTIGNNRGMSAQISDFGATLVRPLCAGWERKDH